MMNKKEHQIRESWPRDRVRTSRCNNAGNPLNLKH